MMMPQVVRIQNITVTAVCTVTVSSVGTPSPPAGRQSKQSVSKSALDNQGFKVPKKFEIFLMQFLHLFLVLQIIRERLSIC